MKAYRGWLMKLFGRTREPDPETEVARQLARRISVKADQLTEHLRTYQRSRDPFAAMMADMYNRDQLTRLHRSIRQ